MVAMGKVTTREIPGGCAFSREDGEEFHMVWVPDIGHVVLYHGKPEHGTLIAGMVTIDLGAGDKVEAALRWVVAYPDHPAP